MQLWQVTRQIGYIPAPNRAQNPAYESIRTMQAKGHYKLCRALMITRKSPAGKFLS
jgi:hypothetical protein